MKKGNNSSNIWALRQIADFMASTSHAVFPASSMSMWVSGCLPGAEEEGGGRREEEAPEAAWLLGNGQAAVALAVLGREMPGSASDVAKN